MKVEIDQSHWYDRLWAAFIFFTRLPFYRLHQPPVESYKAVVEYWPLTGWLTGGLMAATLWVGSMYLPYMIAILLAIVALFVWMNGNKTAGDLQVTALNWIRNINIEEKS